MGSIRMPWAVVVGVVLVVVAVPSIRGQARLQWHMGPWPRPPYSSDVPAAPGLADTDLDPEKWISRALWHHARECAPFTARRYRNDARMLLAAGALAHGAAVQAGRFGDDAASERYRQTAAETIGQAAEISDTPEVWAAYALTVPLPSYDRVGTWGADPLDREDIAWTEREIAEYGLPPEIRPEDATAFLDALHEWQRVDPGNGLPLAMEAWVLYGLHRDSEALSRWEEAARSPTFSTRSEDIRASAARLAEHMGLPAPESEMLADWTTSRQAIVYSLLREGTHMAVYEGLVAHLEGRSAESVRLWNAAADIGRSLQASTQEPVAFGIGAALEGMAVKPVWTWLPDSATGTKGGPLRGGRLWYGEQHESYVGHAGEKLAADLRDRLLTASVREQLLYDSFEGMPPDIAAMAIAGYFLFLGQVVGAQLLVVLLMFAVIASVSRGKVRPSARLPARVVVLAAVAAAATAAAGAIAGKWFATTPFVTGHLVQAVIVLPAVLTLLWALLEGWRARQRDRSSLRSCVLQVRQLLPPTAAVLSLVYLALALGTVILRARVATGYAEVEHGSMAYVTRQLGKAWTEPVIPADAWRAEIGHQAAELRAAHE